MHFIKKISVLVIGAILMAGTAVAQNQQQVKPAEEISEAEMEMLVSFALKSQDIQRNFSMDLQQAIKEQENMSLQRYQLIRISMQNPKMADSLNVTDEEKEAMKELQPKVAELSAEANKKVQALLKESKLTQTRLQEIQLALRSDKELQQRFQKEMMEQQKANAQKDG